LYECANTGLISARLQKSEDGRKKTKELALSLFGEWKTVNSKKMQGLGVGKTERAV
jgi:hypothetical protein